MGRWQPACPSRCEVSAVARATVHPQGTPLDEARWLTSHDIDRLLSQLARSASARKFRLFAVACCRLVWDLLPDDASRYAVLVAERLADDLANASEIDWVHRQARPA